MKICFVASHGLVGIHDIETAGEDLLSVGDYSCHNQ